MLSSYRCLASCFAIILLLLSGVEPRSKIPALTELPADLPDRSYKEVLKDLKAYARKNQYSEDFFFLVDMSQPSGKQRFVVYSSAADSIIYKGLVTHGHCNLLSEGAPVFSNVPESNCSSLGLYKIGMSYQGRFGLAYKLHGLETTNNNAYKRYIVLHAHECVPDQAIHPAELCLSQGCPTVSPLFLQQLKQVISKSSKPVLLKIFN